MGPMNDDDEMVTRPAATTPVESDPPAGPATTGEGRGNDEGVEEGPGLPGIPGMEEAGYGYGV